METLLERASAACDEAEVYENESRYEMVEFVNGKLHDIKASRDTGVSLRILEGGRLGMAYARNLPDPDALVRSARASLAGGVEVGFSLPHTAGLPELATYDEAIEELTVEQVAEEARRVHDRLTASIDGEITVVAVRGAGRVRLRNSAGTDLASRRSWYCLYAHTVYPGSATGIGRQVDARRFQRTPDELIEEIARLYRAGQREVKPSGGRMKVLFMPQSLLTLTWRLESGTSAKSVHEGISPISDRVGELVLDEQITLLDDPRNIHRPGARAFDDEGVPCDRYAVFEKGVLGGFHTDLRYAEKLGIEPTGHGWRSGMWGGDTIALKPEPTLANLAMKPGDVCFDSLVGRMDCGIILESVLGPHSGNIPNGDYSVGVNPGYVVEKGEIVGRVKDAMVAGNVYETLGAVVAVGDRPEHAAGVGWFPPVLCDGVSVACG